MSPAHPDDDLPAEIDFSGGTRGKFYRADTTTMPTPSAKQEALEAIYRLPDNVSLDEIIYRLYVLKKTHQGMQDIEAGHIMSSDDLAKQIEQW